MGKIWMPGGGGGADLDVITVSDPSDVLAGKVIVDKDGNPLTGTLALSGNVSDAQVLYGQTYYNSDPKIKRTGTMPNRGAVSQALGINGTYTIPEGYHNGSGKVTQNITTMAGQTITPSASQQTVSSSGKYMTGNVVVSAVSNLSAGNIKKGIVVGGVTGAWEGYVPMATDLYLRGNNVAGFVLYSTPSAGTITFDSGQITFTSTTAAYCVYVSKDLTGYNYVNMQGYLVSGSNTGPQAAIAAGTSVSSGSLNNDSSASVTSLGDFSISANISSISAVRYIKAYVTATTTAYIYRIWLS